MDLVAGRHTSGGAFLGKDIPPRVRETIECVAFDHVIAVREIMERGRTRRVAYARQETCWRLRQLMPQPTLTMIARWLGLDHTTVLAGIRAHAKRAEVVEAAAIYQGGAL